MIKRLILVRANGLTFCNAPIEPDSLLNVVRALRGFFYFIGQPKVDRAGVLLLAVSPR